jgi:2-polyprenyl-6-methoxyphenol hydroxylase-like FAD-dependent oxidoreductase
VRIVIVGAGPSGLYLGIALARRGHRVTVVERDRGPQGSDSWERKGVMQFHHPHAFRQQVLAALLAEMPEVVDNLMAAGAVPVMMPGQPERPLGVRCRRQTFERVLRSAAERQPGLTVRIGHADAVISRNGRAGGVTVDGHELVADLVIDASGRAGRLTRGLRPPAEGGDCGIAYVSRQYRLLPGAEPGPMNTPIGMLLTYPGYIVIVFPHDNGTLSTLIARASSDRELVGLRSEPVFEAAARAIPALAAWTEPDRSRPITNVLPGGRLYNNYRGQLDDYGKVILDGLIFVGDAVCTTNPAAGRGVATSMMQAQHLLGLLDDYDGDFASCSLAFDQWCDENIRPWFADHVYSDLQLQRRWSGVDVDLSHRLPSDLIMAAAEVDPAMNSVVRSYQAMLIPPGGLAAVEPRAREIYASGWRPPIPAGPTREELADLAARSEVATFPPWLPAA